MDRHSKLQIVEAGDGMRLEANKVYAAPAHSHIIIKKGKLHLVQRPPGPNRAIDLFLLSLSTEDLKSKAIAVILSGAGAVKEAGGLVLAQEPLSCEFDTMPYNTIESGMVDYVTVPFEMPMLIHEYTQANKTL